MKWKMGEENKVHWNGRMVVSHGQPDAAPAFIFLAVAGVVSLIMLLLFKPARVKKYDDKYRAAAGKPLDDALVGRK